MGFPDPLVSWGGDTSYTFPTPRCFRLVVHRASDLTPRFVPLALNSGRPTVHHLLHDNYHLCSVHNTTVILVKRVVEEQRHQL